MTLTVGVWLFFALALVVREAVAWVQARGDRAALLRSGRNGMRRLVADNAVRREGLDLVVGCCYVAVGVLAVVRPVLPLGLYVVLFTACFMGALAVKLVRKILDRRTRMQILAYDLAPTDNE